MKKEPEKLARALDSSQMRSFKLQTGSCGRDITTSACTPDTALGSRMLSQQLHMAIQGNT